MRLAFVGLFLGLLSSSFTSASACEPDDIVPSRIKFPGVVRHCVPHGDFLLCRNDAERLIAVDLRQGKSFDVGPVSDRRWDGDVVDGRVLLIEKDRLRAVAMETGKLVHEIKLGLEPVIAFGCAGKDRAFVHRGQWLSIFELSTGKKLHHIQLGDDTGLHWPAPWQKVGNRLFVTGPASTLCIIDLDTGKLNDRIAVESRAGISSLRVEGGFAYCIGSPFSWGAQLNHLVSVDLEAKTCKLVALRRDHRRVSHFAAGPYGTLYVIEGDRVDRFAMSGDACGSFKMPGCESVLTVWRQHAIVAGINEIRLEEIRETPIARK